MRLYSASFGRNGYMAYRGNPVEIEERACRVKKQAKKRAKEARKKKPTPPGVPAVEPTKAKAPTMRQRKPR